MTEKAGLYIHVPFCAGKCPYCDFYSTEDTRLISAWLDAIEKEILLYTKRFSHFGTLYIGGGTPTVLREQDIEKLAGLVNKYFTFSACSEKTIEANPNDITPDKLSLLSSLGFNRISLGVQSFDSDMLAFLKRRHTVYEAELAIELIRNAGFKNLSIDLMYAIPNQTEKVWIDTLNQAVSFKPEHISCYQLTIKKGTPFWLLKEKLKTLPEDETEAAEEAFFLTTVRLLEDSGYLQYEISNFARDKNLFSKHNLNYWQHINYLGLGPSAHSFADNTRWWNFSDVRKYITTINERDKPVEGIEQLTDDQIRLESLFLSLRTKRGMDISYFQTYKKAGTILPCLLRDKLVKIEGSMVVPTTKGLLVADSIPLLLI
jgi:oxygen-independent coproporphyrinogen-3 oxidase